MCNFFANIPSTESVQSEYATLITSIANIFLRILSQKYVHIICSIENRTIFVQFCRAKKSARNFQLIKYHREVLVFYLEHTFSVPFASVLGMCNFKIHVGGEGSVLF